MGSYHIGLTFQEDFAIIEDIRFINDTQGFADIVVCNEYANTTFLQVADNVLDVIYCQRVNTSKWFIEQDEGRIHDETTRDFDTAPFPAGKLDSQAIP